MNEDRLILYYYRDGLTKDERQQVANALATDAALALRYRNLSAGLARLTEKEAAPLPADRIQRWHESIDRAANLERGRTRTARLHTWSFLAGSAVTAALVVGIAIGMYLGRDDPAAPPGETMVAVDPGPGVRESSAFLRGLQVHLRDSERQLASFPVMSADDRTRLIIDIIEQNRLFEHAAERNDAARLARVLRAFELVLVELAAEETPQDRADEMREKLIFELKVLLTKMSQRPSNEPQKI